MHFTSPSTAVTLAVLLQLYRRAYSPKNDPLESLRSSLFPNVQETQPPLMIKSLSPSSPSVTILSPELNFLLTNELAKASF